MDKEASVRANRRLFHGNKSGFLSDVDKVVGCSDEPDGSSEEAASAMFECIEEAASAMFESIAGVVEEMAVNLVVEFSRSFRNGNVRFVEDDDADDASLSGRAASSLAVSTTSGDEEPMEMSPIAVTGFDGGFDISITSSSMAVSGGTSGPIGDESMTVSGGTAGPIADDESIADSPPTRTSFICSI